MMGPCVSASVPRSSRPCCPSSSSGWSVKTNIPIQKDASGQPKTFNIVYFVMEKVWNCDQYSPDGVVDFYDIKVEFDGKQVSPKWTTNYVDDNCNCRAHVRNETNISITWDTNGESLVEGNLNALPLHDPRRSTLHF